MVGDTSITFGGTSAEDSVRIRRHSGANADFTPRSPGWLAIRAFAFTRLLAVRSAPEDGMNRWLAPCVALIATPLIAATCESLSSLKLPATTITRAQLVTAGG